MIKLYLKVFDVVTLVECESERIASVIRAGFSAFFVEPCDCTLEYKVTSNKAQGFIIQRRGLESEIESDNTYELLYNFEKDLTIELELCRKDLFFVHGAALELGGKAILISAPSGSGKSTTTWALLHHGFNYLSDELAPIALDTLNIQPFPHALNQKKHPPEPYILPEATFKTDRTMHVPVEALPCQVVEKPTPLAAMFYVKYNAEAEVPAIEPISVSEACMHLFANGLNQLQHENKGLATATDIASRVPAYKVETTTNLKKSALIIEELVMSL